MFNIIIFLLGAGIMFFMALRSVLARRRLCTQGRRSRPRWRAPCGAGMAVPMCWPLPPQAAASAALPEAARGKSFAVGDTVTLYYDPDDPEKMYVEGDRATLGARCCMRDRCGPAGADRGHCPLKGEKRMKLEHFGMAEPGDCVWYSQPVPRSWRQPLHRCRRSRTRRRKRTVC